MEPERQYSPARCIGCDKKLENHAAAVALHFIHYNFARIHKTLKVTPAMEAGISDHVWSLEEIVLLAKMEAYNPQQFTPTRNHLIWRIQCAHIAELLWQQSISGKSPSMLVWGISGAELLTRVLDAERC